MILNEWRWDIHYYLRYLWIPVRQFSNHHPPSFTKSLPINKSVAWHMFHRVSMEKKKTEHSTSVEDPVFSTLCSLNIYYWRNAIMIRSLFSYVKLINCIPDVLHQNGWHDPMLDLCWVYFCYMILMVNYSSLVCWKGGSKIKAMKGFLTTKQKCLDCELIVQYHPCMIYLLTIYNKSQLNVGKHSTHGSYGIW